MTTPFLSAGGIHATNTVYLSIGIALTFAGAPGSEKMKKRKIRLKYYGQIIYHLTST